MAMTSGEDLLICTACGTQFDQPAREPLRACRICDDPRQFVPPSGQSWTSLSQMKGKFENKWKRDDVDERIWSIWTEPKFAIGQRAVLLQTPQGNVLWDLITFLDDHTVDFIKSKGGLKAIVISHPHYYTTHIQWAKAFNCPVYISSKDREWLNRFDADDNRRFIDGTYEPIVDGVVAATVGGHFPGSLVLVWDKNMFIADSLVTVPSALYHIGRLPGTTSYAFMWSIPNMIPLPPDVLLGMWEVIKHLEFESTYGAFVGTEVRDKEVKSRVLESMKIQVRNEGYDKHALIEETSS